MSNISKSIDLSITNNSMNLVNSRALRALPPTFQLFSSSQPSGVMQPTEVDMSAARQSAGINTSMP